ncbi:hypothetical protein C472_05352 [Halorubrum tebenquichense DSM 14210]|uniref:DUF2178 domain-containing protein n=2 Tax=Halorubrum tebenquichense TaxID=119434 RepID=M0DWI3_9EURY|nr:DUF2178 domain-containing protein [Halorubrum tebenquichense]ELZ39178.1 hypothetical protein C472_05352 [Halorubrum tebenquichense DSM 14210]
MVGLLIGGILALWIGIYFDRFLVGVLFYWGGFFGMLAVWRLSSVTLYDERDTAIERKASDYTITIFGFVFVLGAPGGIALEESGLVELPAAFGGAMWTLFAIYVVFGVVYTVLRRRS